MIYDEILNQQLRKHKQDDNLLNYLIQKAIIQSWE